MIPEDLTPSTGRDHTIPSKYAFIADDEGFDVTETMTNCKIQTMGNMVDTISTSDDLTNCKQSASEITPCDHTEVMDHDINHELDEEHDQEQDQNQNQNTLDIDDHLDVDVIAM